MESIFLLLIVVTGGYLAYEFISNEKDENVLTRLMRYSPEKINDKKKTKDEEEQDSTEFLKQLVNNISQKVINRSKNIVAHKQMLIEAGMSSDDDSYLNYISKKLIYGGFGGIMGLFLAITQDASLMMKFMLITMCPLVCFRMPDMSVKRTAKKRAEEVTYTLPDAIDLLTICVEAGLGLDSAITRIAVEQAQSAPVLSSEFKRVGKDILAGIPRADAFRSLSKRVASSELRSFIGLLIQSDKLGTSIGQSLKVYAETMRNKRKQKAEEMAAKASIKMTIPLVLFILPATFIVILAPAALSMIKVFSKGAL